MSSTNKTENLGLNSWIGSDKPERLDFNYDNEVLDKVVSEHTGDTVSHITKQERDKWNNYLYAYSYVGNGATSRIINARCPFDARFCIVFADSKTTTDVSFESQSKRNYFAVAVKGSGMYGVSLISDNTVKVSNSPTSGYANEYSSYNMLGSIYNIIFFR